MKQWGKNCPPEYPKRETPVQPTEPVARSCKYNGRTFCPVCGSPPVQPTEPVAWRDALMDCAGALRYIRQMHGELYGVGFDRALGKADVALAHPPVQPTEPVEFEWDVGYDDRVFSGKQDVAPTAEAERAKHADYQRLAFRYGQLQRAFEKAAPIEFKAAIDAIKLDAYMTEYHLGEIANND